MHCCFVMLSSQHASSILGEQCWKILWKSRSSGKDVLQFNGMTLGPIFRSALQAKEAHQVKISQCQVVVSLFRSICVCVCACATIYYTIYTHPICIESHEKPIFICSASTTFGLSPATVERTQLSRGHYTGDRQGSDMHCRAIEPPISQISGFVNFTGNRYMQW